MSIQIGRVMQSEANYREFFSGVPSMYAVDGLPAGQKASIALFGNSWKILRIIDGSRVAGLATSTAPRKQ